MKNFIEECDLGLKNLVSLRDADPEVFESARAKFLQEIIKQLFPEDFLKGAALQREIDWIIRSTPEADVRQKKLNDMLLNQVTFVTELTECLVSEIKDMTMDSAQPQGLDAQQIAAKRGEK